MWIQTKILGKYTGRRSLFIILRGRTNHRSADIFTGHAGIGDGFLSLGGGFGGMFAWSLILSVALLPYFAFREVEATVGADMMRKLLLGRM